MPFTADRAAADKSGSRPWALCRRRRLPNCTCYLANPARASRWFRLDPKELSSLFKCLSQLPGNDEDTQPVIIDLNGHVAIIGRSNTVDQATVCLELDRSLHIWPDYPVTISRQDLVRAVKLGIDGLFIFGKGVPVLACGPQVLFVWMPLPNVRPNCDLTTAQRICTSQVEPSTGGQKSELSRRAQILTNSSTDPVATTKTCAAINGRVVFFS